MITASFIPPAVRGEAIVIVSIWPRSPSKGSMPVDIVACQLRFQSGKVECRLVILLQGIAIQIVLKLLVEVVSGRASQQEGLIKDLSLTRHLPLLSCG